MAILEAQGLVKYYGSRKVVDGVCFEVDVGEVVGLLGSNGAGKTTSFKMATGQISPNALATGDLNGDGRPDLLLLTFHVTDWNNLGWRDPYSFEAANPRHEHEWKVWRNVKLPDGKILIPGVISHSTILVEHPELVADRIIRYAEIVGRENVIAGSDCGFATFAGSKEVHPSIVWAKLKALSDGARIASKQLWRN